MNAIASEREHAGRVVSALMVRLDQIVEGEAVCEDCGKPAQCTIDAEPDYHAAHMCWSCAKPYFEAAFHFAERFWGERKEQSR